MLGKFLRPGGSRAAPPVTEAERASTRSTAELPTAIAGQCCERGCSNGLVLGCIYADGTGRSCLAQLCSDHIGALSSDGSLCRRHVTVMQLLAANRGAVTDGRMPELSDRSFGLVGTIATRLNKRVTEVLHREYIGTPGAEVVFEPTVKYVKRAHILAWERGWSAYTHAGYLCKIVIRVEAAEPPSVQLWVNHDVVVARTPDWIARRLQGLAEDPRARADFFNTMMAGLGGAFHLAWTPAEGEWQ